MTHTLQMTRPLPAAQRVTSTPQVRSPQTAFVLELLKQFDQCGIRYCVLRNCEGLLSSQVDGDVDLQIGNTATAEVIGLTDQVAARYGGVRIVFTQWAGMMRACYCGNAHGTWWGMRLDITRRQTYKGVEFFHGRAILRRAERQDGIRVARPGDAAMLAVLKDILSTGATKLEYVANARRALRCNEAMWLHYLSKHFGVRAARMLEQFIGNPVVVAPAQLVRRLRRGLMMRAMLKRPFATLRARLTSLWDRLSRLRDRPGAFIAVLGADGAGKSTLIEAIRSPLKDALRSEVRYEHSRPNLLPSIARLFGRSVQKGSTADPHGGTLRGPLSSLTRLAYYMLDYTLGFWLKVYPALVRWPCLCVFDRYFYDYRLDPRRSGIALPQWVFRLSSLVVPRPDLLLCLGGRPEAIHERKPELPLAEVERQVKRLGQFSEHTPNAVWIDTAGPMATTVDQALQAITARMSARYSGRR
ncbi:MAG: hypothetical protein JW889_09200 [Verrucomicrobia bacterium]|nr:hypothetical protein [Verrucomicrobiota bacterium]